MTRDVTVILISNAKPREKSAAAITLARHLVGQPGVTLEILHCEAREIFPNSRVIRFTDRIARRGWHRLALDFWFLVHAFLPIHRWLRPPKDAARDTVVLTLAYGNGWLVASKYAARHKLPLIVRYDDWWPDILQVHRALKPLLERKYRELHRNASASICISEGMKRELGAGGRSHVILPIPEAGRAPAPARATQHPFQLGYMGNLGDYGPMLADLVRAAEGASDIRFGFCGTEPKWPAALKQQLRVSGQLHGFLEGEEFQEWFDSFDAYLVAMFFDEKEARRVRTCFATKLLDYSSQMRPIVIWAPESSAVVEWARRTGGALCVTDHDPRAVVAALRELAADPERCTTLGKRARHAYETEFSPNDLQEKFLECLVTSLEPK